MLPVAYTKLGVHKTNESLQETLNILANIHLYIRTYIHTRNQIYDIINVKKGKKKQSWYIRVRGSCVRERGGAYK